ncbi:GNAT family N-acetyltransferase [Mucilaginibacter aquariorum]|uniref:GNAT family N-acetyltransferase n=1 Tax=Mucilaginibacter aquariorum TaxID=2967225 RepID=A0ABT1SY49_9SPHI|nr:GNAT family N-acetyltransferase [Mucilaginibacter aquariorum]
MQFPVHKYGLIFRLVEENDAAFILSLRADPKLSKHLSATDNDLDKQIRWIRQYKQREAEGSEYYFLYTDRQNQPLGVFRLYNIANKTVTSGSWLSKPGNDEFTPIKADLFLTSLIFENLKFDKCFIDVRKDNKKLVRYHKMFFTVINEDHQNIYMFMDKESYQHKREFLTSIIEPQKQ